MHHNLLQVIKFYHLNYQKVRNNKPPDMEVISGNGSGKSTVFFFFYNNQLFHLKLIRLGHIYGKMNENKQHV